MDTLLFDSGFEYFCLPCGKERGLKGHKQLFREIMQKLPENITDKNITDIREFRKKYLDRDDEPPDLIA
jgi:hypothetical protein